MEQSSEIFEHTQIIHEIYGGKYISELIAMNKGILFDYFFGEKFRFKEDYGKYNKNITSLKVYDVPCSSLGYLTNNNRTKKPALDGLIELLKKESVGKIL